MKNDNKQEMAEASKAKELTVEVDGVKYPISSLTPQVQELLRMHQAWQSDLSEATNRVNQLRAAVSQLANQVVETVRSDVAATATGSTPENTDGVTTKEDSAG